jgi:hypothetical protein
MVIEHAPPREARAESVGPSVGGARRRRSRHDGHDIISEQVGWITMDAFRVET